MSVTVVTCLYNIGRDQWVNYQRSWDKYRGNHRVFTQLNVNMVIYVSEEDVAFSEECRKNVPAQTKVIALPRDGLINMKHLSRIREIQSSEKYREFLKDPSCPEVREPLYNALVTSKLDLVKRVVDDNPFRSDLFVWMDGGYGHGQACWPPLTPWIPKKLLDRLGENKITQIRLQPLENAVNDDWGFFRQHIDVVIGGFFAGSATAITRYHSLYYTLFQDCLDKGIVDDDQYYATLLALRHPDLFDPHLGGWYGGFTMFN